MGRGSNRLTYGLAGPARRYSITRANRNGDTHMSTPGAEHTHSNNPQVSYSRFTCPNTMKIIHWMTTGANATMARVACRQVTGRRSLDGLTNYDVAELLDSENITVADIIRINF